jgi:hypothetical protein
VAELTPTLVTSEGEHVRLNREQPYLVLETRITVHSFSRGEPDLLNIWSIEYTVIPEEK